MPVLTTVAALKTHLGITGSTEDTLLGQILDGIDWAVARFTGRAHKPGSHPFSSIEHTEYYDGNGQQFLILKRRPATAIDSVHVDASGYYGHGASAFAAATELTLGTHFAPTSLEESEQNGSQLLRIGTHWPRGMGNIKVVYTAGYTTMPADIVLAVHQIAAAVRHAASEGLGGPIKSERFGEYSYQLMEGGSDGRGSSNTVDITGAAMIIASYRDVL